MTSFYNLTGQYRTLTEQNTEAAELAAENAANSASDAAVSASNAATSEAAAAVSETNADASANATAADVLTASASETAAASSETNAAASAVTATTQAAAAAASESNALSYKTDAEAAQVLAEAAATAVNNVLGSSYQHAWVEADATGGADIDVVMPTAEHDFIMEIFLAIYVADRASNDVVRLSLIDENGDEIQLDLSDFQLNNGTWSNLLAQDYVEFDYEGLNDLVQAQFVVKGFREPTSPTNTYTIMLSGFYATGDLTTPIAYPHDINGMSRTVSATAINVEKVRVQTTGTAWHATDYSSIAVRRTQYSEV